MSSSEASAESESAPTSLRVVGVGFAVAALLFAWAVYGFWVQDIQMLGSSFFKEWVYPGAALAKWTIVPVTLLTAAAAVKTLQNEKKLGFKFGLIAVLIALPTSVYGVHGTIMLLADPHGIARGLLGSSGLGMPSGSELVWKFLTDVPFLRMSIAAFFAGAGTFWISQIQQKELIEMIEETDTQEFSGEDIMSRIEGDKMSE